MDFDELDAKMRVFETSHDYCVLPGIHIVMRVDGRSFTRLTKERHEFETPFDVRMRDYMVATMKHLMQCGFQAIYGFTQSDEISILLHESDRTFGRKLRKLESVFAGEASAKFTSLLSDIGVFDSRTAQLPREGDVVDYFRWRQEDAHRNALNAHCYWMLRKQGRTAERATQMLEKLSVSEKNDLLFESGINYDKIPLWQKHGIGAHWAMITKPAVNPKTGEKVVANRRKLQVDLELPRGDDYGKFLTTLMG
jgi:tRNA(His) guanylyltransferase